jgi:thiamine-phosphate pyrophosphorylase
VNLPPRVLPITPGLCASGGLSSLLGDLAEIKAAGAGGVLLREPGLAEGDMLNLATAAREIFQDGWLGIHDRPHVATLVSADAVHLGYRSLRAEVVRALVGPDVAVGVSHHCGEIGDTSMCADYRFLSPVFPPSTKPSGGETLGLVGLRSAEMMNRTWALGGVNAEVMRSVLGCGPAGVAIIGGVFSDGGVGFNMAALLRVAEAYGEREMHES